MKTHSLSCAETARLIRQAVKRSFPGVKFSVRSHTYSGGASIDVRWTDGPTGRMVDSVVQAYRGGAFDGSIDLATTHTSWLMPDGSACIASDPGTAGSRGSRPAERNWMPSPDARLVAFGANYVFTHRAMSPAFAERVLARVVRRWGAVDLQVHVSKYDGSACLTGSYEAERIAHQESCRFMMARG